MEVVQVALRQVGRLHVLAELVQQGREHSGEEKGEKRRKKSRKIVVCVFDGFTCGLAAE